MNDKIITWILTISILTLNYISVKSQTKNKSELNKAFFENFTHRISDSIPSLGSVLISQGNSLIYEQYFNGSDKETDFNIKSVTKSITSVLAGIAKDKNLLPQLNTSVLEVLPEYNIPRTQFKNIANIESKITFDSIRNTVTINHLLTMRSGFKWVENSDISRAMGNSSYPVRFTLELPFEEYPGDTFNYNTGETYIFGAVLSKGYL